MSETPEGRSARIYRGIDQIAERLRYLPDEVSLCIEKMGLPVTGDTPDEWQITEAEVDRWMAKQIEAAREHVLSTKAGQRLLAAEARRKERTKKAHGK